MKLYIRISCELFISQFMAYQLLPLISLRVRTAARFFIAPVFYRSPNNPDKKLHVACIFLA